MNLIRQAIGVLASSMRLALVASASPIVVTTTPTTRAALTVCVPSGVFLIEFCYLNFNSISLLIGGFLVLFI
jgi:hypothetical protein